MPEERTCDYTGEPIEPGTGIMYIKANGEVLHFVDSKAEKNYFLGREPRDLEWTEAGRAQAADHRATSVDEEPAAEDEAEAQPAGEDEEADEEVPSDAETEDEVEAAAAAVVEEDFDESAETAVDEDEPENEEVQSTEDDELETEEEEAAAAEGN